MPLLHRSHRRFPRYRPELRSRRVRHHHYLSSSRSPYTFRIDARATSVPVSIFAAAAPSAPPSLQLPGAAVREILRMLQETDVVTVAHRHRTRYRSRILHVQQVRRSSRTFLERSYPSRAKGLGPRGECECWPVCWHRFPVQTRMPHLTVVILGCEGVQKASNVDLVSRQVPGRSREHQQRSA